MSYVPRTKSKVLENNVFSSYFVKGCKKYNSIDDIMIELTKSWSKGEITRREKTYGVDGHDCCRFLCFCRSSVR